MKSFFSLLESDYDFVFLQGKTFFDLFHYCLWTMNFFIEIWLESDYKKLANSLQNSLPHSFYFKGRKKGILFANKNNTKK